MLLSSQAYLIFMHRYKVVFGAAVLAAISIVLQVYKIAYPTGVIDIDLVGVPWIVATFLFGISGGLISSVIGAFAIAIVAPTAFVGGIMKFLATVVMILIVWLVAKKLGYGKKAMVAAFVLCLIARPLVMLAFNYYWAIPVFFHIPIETLQGALAGIAANSPYAQFFPLQNFSLMDYLNIFIVIPNIILAITDFGIAYFLVFSTRLRARLND